MWHVISDCVNWVCINLPTICRISETTFIRTNKLLQVLNPTTIQLKSAFKYLMQLWQMWQETGKHPVCLRLESQFAALSVTCLRSWEEDVVRVVVGRGSQVRRVTGRGWARPARPGW